MIDDAQVIFFDGICNLCNSSVQFIIRHDKKNIFKFASLQSDFAKQFFARKNYTPQFDAIVVWTGRSFYERSDAALHIAKKLPFPVKAATLFFIVPKFLRDPAYDFIAGRRYKW
ncbi:MAG: DUF393 domain-containing protein, partial [Chitinophagales bacterium]|nr:DUF393 domain-containing protein [Chitinophagales bacterium]